MLRFHARRLSLLAAAASLAVSAAPRLAFAQAADDAPLKEVENSKFSTSGLITSNAVFVRCGPGDNYYPTMKLDKGAKVKVVGAKFDWLKVVPPDGSFCYVARLYVDRHGDGKVGRVNKDSINVRAGSSLSALKIGILCELSQGEEVEILGEEQEYFRIKPPAKAYLYINKKFVEPDPDAKPEVQAAQNDTAKPETSKPETSKPESTPPEASKPESTKPANTGGDATGSGDFGTREPVKPEGTKPDVKPETPGTGTDTVKPEGTKPEGTKPEVTRPDTPGTENPAKPDTGETPKNSAKPETPNTPKTDVPATPESAEAAFDKAESAFLAAKDQPLEQQPLESLVKEFEAVAKNDALPESMRRVADSRVATLKLRASAQADLLQLRKSQSDLKARQLALQAEQQELQKRIAENTVKIYTAVGTLQPSSLQQGTGGTLYRITDPATGRTVCYLRSNEAGALKLLGQFVGVKGEMREEARLGAKVITPTELTAVDPAKVHTTITAQIIPPSLIPHEPATAQTDPQQ